MNMTKNVDFLNTGKVAFFDRVTNLVWTKKLALSLIFAGLTGISAQVRIPLSWTPVPITGQVLVVLLSGVFLGSIYGGLSMAMYILLGFTGIPWFTGGNPGILLGPTTGYLIGFVPAACFIGYFARKRCSYVKQIIIMIIAVSIIYLFGAANFAILLKVGLRETWTMAVMPFIALDLLKALVAASVIRAILPAQD